MRITEEQMLKLNRAQGLITEVQNALIREDEVRLPEQRTGYWLPVYTAHVALNEVVFLLKKGADNDSSQSSSSTV